MFCVSMSLPMRSSDEPWPEPKPVNQNTQKSEPRDPIQNGPRRPILLRDVGDNPRADRAPASRIAKRKPGSMAIGAISSTPRFTLSPGITISVPSGSPVTSVVRKYKLRTIIGEEWCYVVSQHDILRRKKSVCGLIERACTAPGGARLHPADAAQKRADIVARLALVEQFAEHLDAGDDGLLGVATISTSSPTLTLFDAAGDDGAAWWKSRTRSGTACRADGLGMRASTASISATIESSPTSGFLGSSAASAEPVTIGTSSPSKSRLQSDSDDQKSIVDLVDLVQVDDHGRTRLLARGMPLAADRPSVAIRHVRIAPSISVPRR